MTSRGPDIEALQRTAAEILAGGKGILAADESTGTITKRFEAVGVESTEETRRRFRDLLFTTEGIEDALGGVILWAGDEDNVDAARKAFTERLRLTAAANRGGR